jgi:hypothetical protein
MRKRSAFTLVEMALVLTLTTVIIGVLTVLYGYTMANGPLRLYDGAPCPCDRRLLFKR